MHGVALIALLVANFIFVPAAQASGESSYLGVWNKGESGENLINYADTTAVNKVFGKPQLNAPKGKKLIISSAFNRFSHLYSIQAFASGYRDLTIDYTLRDFTTGTELDMKIRDPGFFNNAQPTFIDITPRGDVLVLWPNGWEKIMFDANDKLTFQQFKFHDNADQSANSLTTLYQDDIYRIFTDKLGKQYIERYSTGSGARLSSKKPSWDINYDIAAGVPQMRPGPGKNVTVLTYTPSEHRYEVTIINPETGGVEAELALSPGGEDASFAFNKTYDGNWIMAVKLKIEKTVFYKISQVYYDTQSKEWKMLDLSDSSFPAESDNRVGQLIGWSPYSDPTIAYSQDKSTFWAGTRNGDVWKLDSAGAKKVVKSPYNPPNKLGGEDYPSPPFRVAPAHVNSGG